MANLERSTSGWGADLEMELRPGVPMEHEPRPVPDAHWKQPVLQPRVEGLTHRAELDDLTPVFGTAQPPKGIAGRMRRKAYRIPEHHTAHWLLLLSADRVEVLMARLKRISLFALPAAAALVWLRRREA